MSLLGWRFQPCPPYQPSASAGGPGCLAGPAGSEGVSASCGSGWLRRCRSGHLLHRSSDGRACGPVTGASAEPPVCRLAPGPDCQAACHQRSSWPGDGSGRLSAVHQTRGAGGPATFFCSWVQESPPVVSLGGRSLISSFTRQLSQVLALTGACAVNLLSLC